MDAIVSLPAVVSPGLAEMLVVIAMWLLLFGGWRLTRNLFRSGQWFYYDLRGDTTKARQAEKRLGEALAESLIEDMPLDSDSSRGTFVHEVAEQLVGHVNKPRCKLQFKVVCSKQPNAFALPGGFVFVTNAMVRYCGQDRDQMAFVLAHEMAHILRSHVRNRLVDSIVMSVVASVVAGGSRLGKVARRWVLHVLTSAYTQDQEFDADKTAMELMRRAGFDGQGSVRLLTQLRDRRGDSPAASYLSSHPPLAARIARIR